MCSSDLFLSLIALIFPPLPVWIKRGLCSPDALINICLCLLGVLPGLIHSWYIIYSTPDYVEYAHVIDVESGLPVAPGGVRYYYYTDNPELGYKTFEYQAQPQPRPNNQPQQQQAPAEATVRTEVPPPYVEAIKGDNKVQEA